MKVLVTGSEGFIGSHLVEKLVRRGFEVRCFSLYAFDGHEGWLGELSSEIRDHIEIFPGDIRDADRVLEAVGGCQRVFHLASLIGIPYSYKAVESYISTNIVGTKNVLSASLTHSVSSVIHTSTSEVYGSAQYVPIDENHPLVGQSPYAASKIAADQFAIAYHKSFDLPVTVLRPFNTYGPRQSMRAVIPTIITQALAESSGAIRIGSLTTSRDLTFVDDTAEAFVKASDSTAAIGETINLGTGFDVQISSLLDTISEILSMPLYPVEEESRIRPEKSEVRRLVSDNSKARKLLSWAPELSGEAGLREGLSRTIDWWLARRSSLAEISGKYWI